MDDAARGFVDPSRLPYPIAAPLQRLRRAVSRNVPDKALTLAFDVVEETARYTNARLLGSLLASGEAPPGKVRDALGAKQTLGKRTALMLLLARGCPDDLVAAVVRDGWSRGPRLGQTLDRLVAARNAHAHAPSPDRQQAADALRPLLEDLARLGALYDELSGETLVSVFRSADAPGASSLVLRWDGPQPPVDELPQQIPAAADAGAVLCLRTDAEPLQMSPFVVYRDDPLQEHPDLWVVDRLAASAAGAWSGGWLNARTRTAGVPADIATDLSTLASWSPAHAPASSTSRLEDYYFASTPLLMERLLGQYVDRPEAVGAVARLREQQPAGSLWITAPAGSGKSSVLSALVQQLKAVHHFVSGHEGRDNQAAILRSLIAQLLKRGDSDALPYQDDNLLPQQLSNLLIDGAVSRSEEPTFIAIDALDELGDAPTIERFLRSLPTELPTGTYLLVSTRQLPPAVRIPEGAQTFELRALTVADVQQVARKHGLPDDWGACERAFVASQGNPLFAVWALRLLRDDPDAAIDLSRNLDDLLGPRIGPALDAPDDDRARLLALLVASASPLDVATVSEALAVPRRQALAAVGGLRDLLVASGGQIALVHKVVRDYLTDDRSLYALEPELRAWAHGVLADAADGLGGYDRRHRPLHLAQSGRWVELARELDRPPATWTFAEYVMRLADREPEDAERLLLAVLSDDGCSRQSAQDVLERLAEACYPALVGAALAAPASGRTLGDVGRRLVSLAGARARDDVREMALLSTELLDRPDLAGEELPEDGRARLWLLRGEGLRLHGGDPALALGGHRDAQACYEEALATARPGGPLWFAASFQLADLDYVYGRLSASRGRLFELAAIARTEGYAEGRVRVLRELGHVDLSLGDLDAARERYREALELALVSGMHKRISECYVSLAEATAAVDLPACLDLARLGIEHGRRAGARVECGKALYVLAEGLLAAGDPARALMEGRDALSALDAVGYGSGRARAHLVCGEALLAQSQGEEAMPHLLEAVRYYAREGIYPHLRLRALTAAGRAVSTAADRSLIRSIDREENIPHLEELQRRPL